MDYTTKTGEPVIEGQVVRIAYGLVAETGKFQEDCRTWQAKLEPENTWTKFQAHFIKAQDDLQEQQKNSHQGGYHTGTANNSVEMSMAFPNISQATEED